MQDGVITISQKELTRCDVLRRVLDGTISLADAAGYMGVSYRHAKRIKSKAEEGAIELVHGNRDHSPSNRLDAELQQRILTLSREEHKEFNDTHFTEELAKLGVMVSRECALASP